MPFENDLTLRKTWDNARRDIQDAITEIDQCCVYTGMSTGESPANYLTVGFGGVVPTRCDYLIVILTDDNVLISIDDGSTWLNIFDPAAVAGETLVPTGMVVEYGGDENNVPTGFLLCDGDAVDRTTYADLFAEIGTTYGSGDGSTTFNLPDMRGKSPRGVNNTDYSAGANGALNTLDRADVGGQETHTLVDAEMASHTHLHHPGAARSCGNTSVSVGVSRSGASNTGVTGSDGSHNELHPGIVVNYIIKT